MRLELERQRCLDPALVASLARAQSKGNALWQNARRHNDVPTFAPALAELIALRQAQRALRVGDYRPITAERLLAFERHTDRVADTVIVVANPSDEAVSETVMIANSKLMNVTHFSPLLDSPPASHHRPCHRP